MSIPHNLEIQELVVVLAKIRANFDARLDQQRQALAKLDADAQCASQRRLCDIRSDARTPSPQHFPWG